MAVEVEKLIATLEARIDKYERDLRKAYGTTDRQFTKIERRGRAMERRLAEIGGAASRTFVAAFAGAMSIRAAQQLIDSATGITNALKVAGLEGDNLKTVYDSLFASAQKNAAPLEALVTLYNRASQSAADLGASQADLLSFTDKIALALRISGQSASESAGALLQLSQALGNGVVQAEEYNSLLDGGRTILQATAAGLKEAGGSVSALTRLVKSGKVSSEAFFRAFLAGAPTLEKKVAGAETTVSQHMVRLQNVLIDTAGKFNEVAGVSEFFGTKIDTLADTIAAFGGVLENISDGPVVTFLGKLAGGINTVSKFIDMIGGLKNLPAFEGALSGVVQDKLAGTNNVQGSLIQGRINGAFDNAATKTTAKTGRLPKATPTATTPVKPVSLSDYHLPTTSGSGSGGGSSVNDFQREVEQIQRRTKSLEAMTTAQASLNPLINDYGFAVEKAHAVQELLNAAQEQGLIKTADLSAATPELRNSIISLAEGYAAAEVAANRQAEAQDRVRESATEMRDLGRDVLGGFISDIEHGTSAADALASALGKIGDKLVDLALNGLFDSKGGIFGGGGFLSSLFGGGSQLAIASAGGIGLYHSGGVVGSPSSVRHGVSPGLFAGATRYHTGGVAGLKAGEVPAILQRGEVILPKNVARSGAMPAITYAPVYNVTGSGPEIDALRKQIAKDQAQFPSKVIMAIHGARKHSVKI